MVETTEGEAPVFQDLTVFRTAMAMVRHAGHQQAISAQNIANADTPGYRALTMNSFSETVRPSQSGAKATRVGHLHGTHSDATYQVAERRDAQDPNGNTVALELELLEAVNADRQSNRALSIYRSNLTVLRASLGRG